MNILNKITAYFKEIERYFLQNLFNRGFGICCVIVFLYILPIILANVPYADDYARYLKLFYWDHDTRLLSTFLYKLFSVNGKLAIFIPWGLIAGSFILCASAYLFSIKFNPRDTLAAVIAVAYLFLSPFLLQPLNFQFDALPLLFSINFCLWIFLIPNRNIFTVIIPTFIFTFCCLLTYQASITIIPTLSFLELIMFIRNNDNPKFALKVFFTRFCSSAISMTAWYFMIYKSSRYSAYDIVRSNVSIRETTEEIIRAILNWHVYSDFVLAVLCILFVAFCGIIIALVMNILRKTTLYHRVCVIMIAFSPFIILFMGIPGINIIQKYTMHARLFISFSMVLFALMFFLLAFYRGLFRTIIIFLSVIPMLYSFGLSYSYGNALRYNYEIKRSVANSLMNAIDGNERIFVTFKGVIKKSKNLENIFKIYPYIENLFIFEILKERYSWQSILALSYYGLNNIYIDKPRAAEALLKDIDIINESKLISEHYYYNLLRYDDIYIIDFNKTDLSKNRTD
jgi:hypothetical protein